MSTSMRNNPRRSSPPRRYTTARSLQKQNARPMMENHPTHAVADQAIREELESPVTSLFADPLSILPFRALPRWYQKDPNETPRQAIRRIFETLKQAGMYENQRWVELPERDSREWKPGELEGRVAGLLNDILMIANSGRLEDFPMVWRKHTQAQNDVYRYPDVVLTAEGFGLPDGTIPSSATYAYCEVKYKYSPTMEKEAWKQLTEMAGLVTTAQFGRRFYLGMSLCGPLLTLAVLLRGATLFSSALNIHEKPEEFINILLSLSEAYNNAVWTGFDETHSRNTEYKYLVEFESQRVPVPDPSEPTLLELVRYGKEGKVYARTVLPLFRATGMAGKGTVASAVRMHMSPSDFREGEKGGKDGVLKECWSLTDWPDDIEINRKLNERSPKPLSPEEEDIFGKADLMKVFSRCEQSPTLEWDDRIHLPGKPIVVEWHECQHRMPALSVNYDPLADEWGEYIVQDDTTENIIHRFMFMPDANGEPPTIVFEPRKRIRVLCRTHGIPIVFFSCRREFINGFMGAVIGHFNGLRKDILHCDPSPDNVWFRILSRDPKIATPGLVEVGKTEKGQPIFQIPLRPGMMGDWGSGIDLVQRDDGEEEKQGFITGTLPYTATALIWQDLPFRSKCGAEDVYQTAEHDLESLFWVMWSLSVTQDGPYDTLRHWEDPGTVNSATTQRPAAPTPSANADQPSVTPRYRYGTNLLSHTLTSDWRRAKDDNNHRVPAWLVDLTVVPEPIGVYEWRDKATDVDICKPISPYFANGAAGAKFLAGMKELYSYFKWEPNAPADKPRITHKKFLEILQGMRDAIDEADDTPSQETVTQGQKKYSEWLQTLEQRGFVGQETATDGRKSGGSKRPLSVEGGGSDVKKPRRS